LLYNEHSPLQGPSRGTAGQDGFFIEYRVFYQIAYTVIDPPPGAPRGGRRGYRTITERIHFEF
jgi:hypothetical protein